MTDPRHVSEDDSRVVRLPNRDQTPHARRKLRITAAPGTPEVVRIPKGKSRRPPGKTGISVVDAETPARLPRRRYKSIRVIKAATPPAAAELPEAGRYKFRDVLGTGGMGTVYRAHDELLDMDVAIKLLRPELTHDSAAVSKLREEARMTMQLAHPHIVRLHDLRKLGGQYMLIMEYVEGASLRGLLAEHGCFMPGSTVDVIDVCADALAYAHRHGLLHNDLKPENILITSDGVLKVIDFGTAGLVNTRIGGEYILGTPAYMSPEQIRGDVLDVRTDVYALGMIAYELLCGYLPYPRDVDFDDILVLARREMFDVPEHLQPVIARATAPERDARWGTVDAFAAALSQAKGDNPTC